ncbi:hypothetical protein RYH80_16185 [Halobaculum sp. MBLA0147]|uniref:hypothetical protein n=1 Tax=Halobaculum sp. MBLA0147 TaxID=3079934 RepID=UPI003524522F
MGAPDDTAELFGESALSLDEYLDRHAAVGHWTQYEILYRLVHDGDTSPTELADGVGVVDNIPDGVVSEPLESPSIR